MYYLSRVDQIDQFFKLIDRSRLHRLDRDAVLVGLAREFWQETIGRFVTEEDDTTFTQTLDGAVQTAGCGAEIDHNIYLSVASIFGPVN